MTSINIKKLLQSAKDNKPTRGNLYNFGDDTVENVISRAKGREKSKKKNQKVVKENASQCIIIIPDVHAHDRDEPAYELVMQHALPELAKAYNVTKFVQLGDLLDVAELTSHPKSHVDETVPKYEDELNWAVDDFWARAMETLPNAEFHALMGNHEHRINTYVCKNFGKKEFAKHINDTLEPTRIYEDMGIKVTPYGAEYAYENMLEIHPGLFCVHGWSFSTHAAATHLNKVGAGMSMIFGHTHRIDSYVKAQAGTGTLKGAWSMGALQKKNRYYNKGTPNDHALGFGIVLTHGDAYTVYTIPIHGNEFKRDKNGERVINNHRHCILPNGKAIEIDLDN